LGQKIARNSIINVNAYSKAQIKTEKIDDRLFMVSWSDEKVFQQLNYAEEEMVFNTKFLFFIRTEVLCSTIICSFLSITVYNYN
jgi:hypothetical protein